MCAPTGLRRIVITVPQKGVALMKIGISRTAGAVALASALVVSGLVLAAAPSKKPPSSAVRGQAAEYASMCRFCESTGGACYAFGSGGASPELAMRPDAGMSADA